MAPTVAYSRGYGHQQSEEELTEKDKIHAYLAINAIILLLLFPLLFPFGTFISTLLLSIIVSIPLSIVIYQKISGSVGEKWVEGQQEIKEELER
jgi:predicted ferric reductase